MVSGMLHAGVIVFLVTSGLPSCGDGRLGTGAESGEFREVGIYVKQPAESQTQPDEQDVEEPKLPQSATAGPPAKETAQATESVVATLIAVPVVQSQSTIGQSRTAPAPGGVPTPSEALVTPNAIRSPQSAGEGPGNVSFMGKTTEAQTVVYVIDTSHSMLNNDALVYAKVKLQQSINGLGQKQQFQIISYAIAPTVMRLKNDSASSPVLYRAIGPNLALARQYINTMQPDGGTKHYPALREAFRFKPDVIFLLTDADVDSLSPKELDEIKTGWNKTGKTHIHCIQFGTGPDLKLPTSMFLRKLASENRGSYTYLDVSQLAAP
jgi:hypothetical protein